MASSTAAGRPRKVVLGSKIMGRDHAHETCAVRRPQYDERGKFEWNGVTFAQACLGTTAPAQEDFFVQVIEDVMKHDDCWTITGRRNGAPAGSRRRAPLEVVRQPPSFAIALNRTLKRKKIQGKKIMNRLILQLLSSHEQAPKPRAGACS